MKNSIDAYDYAQSVIVSVKNIERFILRTQAADYALDFQKLIKDYGVQIEKGDNGV